MKTIAIIGAGPAGIICSLYLAKRGIQSTLIDKSFFPRHKPCGDNIAGNVLRILNEIAPGFLDRLLKEKKIPEVKGFVAFAANNHKMKIDFLPLEVGTDIPSCYTVSRKDLDNEMIKLAKSNPLIEVIEGYKVSSLERKKGGLLIKSHNQSIFCRLAIICNGSNGNIVKNIHTLVKEDAHFAVGIRAYYKNVKPFKFDQYSELYIIKKLLPGGLYITPLTNGMVNVTVVVRKDVIKKNNLNLKQILLEELGEHPLLKDRFAAAELVGKIEGGGLLLGTQKRRISGDNFMLAGDAAGLIDLLSANGIPQAMLNGRIAAEFAAKCVQENDFSSHALADYDSRVYDRVKNYLKMSKLVSPLLSYKIVIYIFLKAMNFIAKKYDKSDQIRDLLYDQKASEKLLKPSFYYKLFFGIKNPDASSKDPR